MAGNDMEITHAEMWDDSALIDSWNEALDEYKVRGHWCQREVWSPTQGSS